jgi:hypothetical protein
METGDQFAVSLREVKRQAVRFGEASDEKDP